MMLNQTANELKQQGMSVAIAHADQVHEGWSDEAYALLKEFVALTNHSFMCEDFRAFAALKGLPEAPSKRAFGAVIAKAHKHGLIAHAGYSSTKNPRAHRTPASCWMAK